jgi:hypothetical protein
MAADPEALDQQGRWNYFNYFTEIEEHFQRARGTGLFLLSPLDWALIEGWKNSGIPLEAVLRGIDVAFEKWHAKKKKQQTVNSVAYCAQAVHEEAQALSGTVSERRPPVKPPFEIEDLRKYLQSNAGALRERSEYKEIAASLDFLLSNIDSHYLDLEELEQRLTALADKMSAIAKTSAKEEDLLAARRELDATLRPYRSKMTAEQLALLERQYLDRRILEKANLPRLSLFYMK